MKIKIIILLVLISSLLSAINLEKLLLENKLSFSVKTYVGDQFQVKLEKNKHSYKELRDLRFRWETLLPNNMGFWSAVKTREDATELVPYIDGVGAYINIENLKVEFKMDHIKRGNGSRIIARNLNDPDYDYSLLQYYRFNGLRIDWKIYPSCNAFAMCGGNIYNSSICVGGFDYLMDKAEINLYGMFIGRSSVDNRNTIVAGAEGNLDLEKMFLYLGLNYHRNISENYDYYRFFGELLFKPFDFVEIGGNYFYKDLFYVENVSRGLLACTIDNFSISFIYIYNETELKLSNYYLNTFTFIPKYAFNDFFKIGLNCSYLSPNIVEDYYNLGFQIEFNYEMD